MKKKLILLVVMVFLSFTFADQTLAKYVSKKTSNINQEVVFMYAPEVISKTGITSNARYESPLTTPNPNPVSNVVNGVSDNAAPNERWTTYQLNKEHMGQSSWVDLTFPQQQIVTNITIRFIQDNISLDFPEAVSFSIIDENQTEVELTPIDNQVIQSGTLQYQGTINYQDILYTFDNTVPTNKISIKVTPKNQKRVSNYSSDQNSSVGILEIWFTGY